MGMLMKLAIVSAEEEIFSGMVREVYAPSVSGELGIYPRHTQLLSVLSAGDVRVKPENTDEMLHYFVNGGMLEIQPDNVTILADTVIRAKDLDEARVLEAKQKAEEEMKNGKTETELARAQAALIETEAQLRFLEKLRRTK